MISNPGPGHNSLAPMTFDSAADLPRDIPRMHYFKCDIDALWDVLVEMPLEMGGFYMRAILSMYKHMEGLPADDEVARMRLGGMDIRTYRRLKAVLLARPKCLVERPSGRISNGRFEEEIISYVTEFKKRRDAAIEREAQKRSAQRSRELPGKVGQKSAELRPEVPAKSAGSPPNIRRDVFEILNEINMGPTTVLAEIDQSGGQTVVPHARVIRTIVREEKEESQTQSLDLPLPETRISGGVQKARKSIPYSADFEAFWSAYPDRTNNSKSKAWEAWRKLTPAERQQASASLPTFSAYCRANPTYRCVYAERYLSEKRFETQGGARTSTALAIASPTAWWRDASKVATKTPEMWRKAIEQFANGSWLVEKLGPPPGHALCVVPSDVLTELRLTEIYDTAGARKTAH